MSDHVGSRGFRKDDQLGHRGDQVVDVVHLEADLVATGLQHLMYTLTVLIVVSGLVLAFSAHLFTILYGHTGTLPKDFEDFTSHDIHGWLVNGLLVVVGLHVAAALQHQFILKDSIMSRISLFARD